MLFGYFRTVTELDSIDIEDPGNTCINALNDEGDEYYLIVTTKNGWMQVVEFGPLIVDSDKTKSYFDYRSFSCDYNEKKLNNTIDKFLNNNRRMITQVFELDKSVAEEKLRTVLSKHERGFI